MSRTAPATASGASSGRSGLCPRARAGPCLRSPGRAGRSTGPRADRACWPTMMERTIAGGLAAPAPARYQATPDATGARTRGRGRRAGGARAAAAAAVLLARGVRRLLAASGGHPPSRPARRPRPRVRAPGGLRVQHRLVLRRRLRGQPARGPRAPAAAAPRHRAVQHPLPAVPRRWTDRLDLDFEDVDLRVLEDVGHFVPLEAPDAVAGAIREIASRPWTAGSRPRAASELAPSGRAGVRAETGPSVSGPDGGRRRNNAATPGPR